MHFNFKRFYIGMVLVAIYLVLNFYGIHYNFSNGASGTIVSQIQQSGDVAVLGSLFVAIIHQFLPFPGHVFTIANLIIFGPIVGFVVTMLGWLVSSQMGFFLAKFVGRPIEKIFIKKSMLKRVDQAVEKEGPLMILALRFTPLLSFSLLNFAFGLVNLPWWRFTWTTMVGVIPSTVFATAVGAGFVSLSNEEMDWIVIALILISATLWSIRPNPEVKKAY